MGDRLHVHVPCHMLKEHLGLLLENRLQPEIGLKWDDLEKPVGELIDCCRQLEEEGLGIIFHAPFMDLNPGALEPLVRKASKLRFRQTLDLAGKCRASLAVFHPGYDRWRYGGRSEPWLEASLAFWPDLINQAGEQECLLALENIFDDEPEPLATLIEELDNPWVGHCFDIGHWNLFAKVPLRQWLSAFRSRLIHLHLHDNDGTSDAHLPAGEGNIDFEDLFQQIDSMHRLPTATLEIHSKAGLLRTIPFFAARFRP
ncbi:MAG: sugar phosphate isomerase/epimerase family protein [Syntrophotaleaceae bacterium]